MYKTFHKNLNHQISERSKLAPANGQWPPAWQKAKEAQAPVEIKKIAQELKAKGCNLSQRLLLIEATHIHRHHGSYKAWKQSHGQT